LTKEELADLMLEFDVDRSGKLNIDEFVQILTSNDEFEFKDVANKENYQKLKKSRQLDGKDFMGAFADMPLSIEVSFMKRNWTRAKQNLPSHELKIQIDSKTFYWQDMRPTKKAKK